MSTSSMHQRRRTRHIRLVGVLITMASLVVAFATTAAANDDRAPTDSEPAYIGERVDTSIDPDGYLPDTEGLAAASPPICVQHEVRFDWLQGDVVNVWNECPYSDHRVKAIIAWGPDSACHRLKGATFTKPVGGSFTHNITPDGVARFDGLVSC